MSKSKFNDPRCVEPLMKRFIDGEMIDWGPEQHKHCKNCWTLLTHAMSNYVELPGDMTSG